MKKTAPKKFELPKNLSEFSLKMTELANLNDKTQTSFESITKWVNNFHSLIGPAIWNQLKTVGFIQKAKTHVDKFKNTGN